MQGGIAIPDEIALVGYDDIQFAGASVVPLTSIRQPSRLIGEISREHPPRGGGRPRSRDAADRVPARTGRPGEQFRHVRRRHPVERERHDRVCGRRARRRRTERETHRGAGPVKHHDEAVERYVARVSADPDVLAVVVTGSVARGTERPDSDVDLYLVVTEDRWDAAFDQQRLMYVEHDGIGYDGGYYDIKLATLSYLDDAAERGDDPVRDSFAISRIAFSRVDDLAERIDRIGAVDDAAWDEAGRVLRRTGPAARRLLPEGRARQRRRDAPAPRIRAFRDVGGACPARAQPRVLLRPQIPDEAGRSARGQADRASTPSWPQSSPTRPPRPPTPCSTASKPSPARCSRRRHPLDVRARQRARLAVRAPRPPNTPDTGRST